MFWLALVTKMAITAPFVSAATVIAERLSATAGALVATLPVSAGPVYVFRALDHDATFISASAVASLALNAATAIFVTAYVLVAQRRSLWISVSLAFAIWLGTTVALSPVRWTAGSAFILNVVVFALCFLIVEPFCFVRMPVTTTRPWYDLVIRAGMLTLLVGAVVTLSFRVGPVGSGVLAVFPVIYMSIMVILHRRVGGAATAAVLANAIPGLAGFGSTADFASHSSTPRVPAGPHSYPRCLSCLECRRVCHTPPPIFRVKISSRDDIWRVMTTMRGQAKELALRMTPTRVKVLACRPAGRLEVGKRIKAANLS